MIFAEKELNHRATEQRRERIEPQSNRAKKIKNLTTEQQSKEDKEFNHRATEQRRERIEPQSNRAKKRKN
ncbi:MAG: hypothetical protein QM541_09110 [Flavobacterium sp.]|nr:hypothetical protein [Flavobacterium sp.]